LTPDRSIRLTIEGEARELTPIKLFRTAYDLPPEFGVAFFEPKDWTGLGRIDRAGAELNSVRSAMLDALPAQMAVRGWLAFLPDYVRLFESKLYEINPQVGLKDVEIEFAVAGLSDVLQAAAYELVIRHPQQGEGFKLSPTDVTQFFRTVYTTWLDNSVRVFTETYTYAHRADTWQIQIFAHAYGRAGLIVRMSDAVHYVYDPALACPAEGFMAALLGEIIERMVDATV
jgi:hypothetical protein